MEPRILGFTCSGNANCVTSCATIWRQILRSQLLYKRSNWCNKFFRKNIVQTC